MSLEVYYEFLEVRSLEEDQIRTNAFPRTYWDEGLMPIIRDTGVEQHGIAV